MKNKMKGKVVQDNKLVGMFNIVMQYIKQSGITKNVKRFEEKKQQQQTKNRHHYCKFKVKK